MRLYLILTVILFSLVFYLNRAYASPYDLIGQKNLQTPYTKDTFIIQNPPSYYNTDKLTTLKYVAMGDSLTAGVGSDKYQDTFPYVYAQNLLNKSYEVTFVNLSEPGITSSELVKNQLSKAITENPDYITLLIGINDVHNFNSLDQFRKNLSTTLNELHTSTHANITLMTIPLLGVDNFPYPFNYLLQRRTNEFNQAIKTLPEIKYARLVDLYLPGPDYYSSDKFHPNNQGYIFWGKLINAD
jgi:lysophospholipase L1-like esterase